MFKRIAANVVLLTAAVAAAAPPQANVDQALDGVHAGLNRLADVLHATDAQKAKFAEIEKTAASEMRADPAKATDRAYQDSLVSRVRAVVDPGQQKQLDEMLARQKMLLSASNLQQIGLGVLIYQNEHGSVAPAKLSDLYPTFVAAPATFLAGGTGTAIPDDWAKLDAKAKADWIDKNSEFVYLAAGKKPDQMGTHFVVAYVKTEMAVDGNSFLMGDGSVQHKTADTARKILDDLTAGKNPPPSYQLELPTPPATAPAK